MGRSDCVLTGYNTWGNAIVTRRALSRTGVAAIAASTVVTVRPSTPVVVCGAACRASHVWPATRAASGRCCVCNPWSARRLGLHCDILPGGWVLAPSGCVRSTCSDACLLPWFLWLCCACESLQSCRSASGCSYTLPKSFTKDEWDSTRFTVRPASFVSTTTRRGCDSGAMLCCAVAASRSDPQWRASHDVDTLRGGTAYVRTASLGTRGGGAQPLVPIPGHTHTRAHMLMHTRVFGSGTF